MRLLRTLSCAVVLIGCSAEPRTEPSQAAPIATPSGPAPVATASHDDDCPSGFSCDRDALDRSPPPRVTSILVEKRAHALHLVAGGSIVRSYRVALGSGGLGQKTYEGDRVTPIGVYRITGRYESKWHTYLALDYPTPPDRQRWTEAALRGEVPQGKGPGSAIAIHGRRSNVPDGLHKLVDWTLGCVALDNDEIDEVADHAPVGTRVEIRP